MQLSAVSVFKTLEITSTVEFLSSEASANRFLQNNCSKQRLKLRGRCAEVLIKDFNVYVFFMKNFVRKKSFFAMSMPMPMPIPMPRCRCGDFQIAHYFLLLLKTQYMEAAIDCCSAKYLFFFFWLKRLSDMCREFVLLNIPAAESIV